jgi:hypothetical protein
MSKLVLATPAGVCALAKSPAEASASGGAQKVSAEALANKASAANPQQDVAASNSLAELAADTGVDTKCGPRAAFGNDSFAAAVAALKAKAEPARLERVARIHRVDTKGLSRQTFGNDDGLVGFIRVRKRKLKGGQPKMDRLAIGGKRHDVDDRQQPAPIKLDAGRPPLIERELPQMGRRLRHVGRDRGLRLVWDRPLARIAPKQPEMRWRLSWTRQRCTRLARGYFWPKMRENSSPNKIAHPAASNANGPARRGTSTMYFLDLAPHTPAFDVTHMATATLALAAGEPRPATDGVPRP